ncbi:sugar phosphate isomerase/epimerase [Salinilacihabitans rarus]|uniref:sugar phosphate isomerase/epimerase n=1 Tax=Salinilacihabitans rarus TaxID=2961596 RepID=UPI0020C93859|nr:sugar phosphate isomerase/epimerase [Salinilacihabitans rarus]
MASTNDSDSGAEAGIDLDLDLGVTVGPGMSFDEAVGWAADEAFAFVELLLDGPYARERIADRRDSMRATLADAGVGIVVHLPFAADPGSPFVPVREGVVGAAPGPPDGSLSAPAGRSGCAGPR